MEIWAHRLRVSPIDFGNSLAGLRMLKQMRVDGVEADISFSKDKEIIIYHPGTLSPDLITLTSQEIVSTKLPIMTLRNLLEFMKAKPGLKCCLDIKQNSKALVKKTVDLMTYYELENKIYLTAFQKRMPILGIESGLELLDYAKEICPKIQTHIIATWPTDLPFLARVSRPDIISLGWLNEPCLIRLTSLTIYQLLALTVDLKGQIEEVQRMGVKVLAGIVNRPDDMTHFADLGVDGIMTDRPYEALRFFQKT